MILNERDARHEHILQAARQIMTAARTAPKGKGIDIIAQPQQAQGSIIIKYGNTYRDFASQKM